jgi:hypothetical protein
MRTASGTGVPASELIRSCGAKAARIATSFAFFMSVSASTWQSARFHSVIKVLAKHRKQVQCELPPPESESPVSTRKNPEDVASRIAALKAKPVEQKARPKHFHFEESEPLKLVKGEWR